MEGIWETNKEYQKERNAFLLSNEGFRETAYFDTVGIPTGFEGVALVARAAGGTKSKRKFEKHKKNLAAINESVSTDKYKEIDSFADKAVSAINDTPEPDYKGKKTAANFEATERGKKVEGEFGHLNKKWESTTSPKVTKEEADKISEKVLVTFEEKLDNLISKIGIAPADLTNSQRIVLLDALYQGRWLAGGKQAATQMKAKASVEVVCKVLKDNSVYSTYKPRIDKACRLLNPSYKPDKPKPKPTDKLKAQKRASDPVKKEMKHGVAVHSWMEEVKANSLFNKIRRAF